MQNISRRNILFGSLGVGLAAAGLAASKASAQVGGVSAATLTTEWRSTVSHWVLDSRIIQSSDVGQKITMKFSASNASQNPYSAGVGYMSNGSWVTVSIPNVISASTSTTTNMTFYATSGMVGTFLIAYVDATLTANTTVTGVTTIGSSSQTLYATATKGTTSTPTPTPTSTGPSVPYGASSVGYNRLAFHDDFDSLSTFDVNNTGNSGYNWYMQRPFGWGMQNINDISLSGSVLTLNQSLKYLDTSDASNPTKQMLKNWGIGTAHPSTKNGFKYQYGYAEARMKFNPSDALKTVWTGVGASSGDTNTSNMGWPAFWSVDADQAFGAGKDRSTEIDYFEYFGDFFAGSAHDMIGINTGNFVDRGNSPRADISVSKADNQAPMFTGFNWNTFHTYGCQWTPGNLAWYVDDNKIINLAYSANGYLVPNDNQWGTGIMSPLDTWTNGQILSLGTGIDFPIQVDWVHVWQK